MMRESPSPAVAGTLSLLPGTQMSNLPSRARKQGFNSLLPQPPPGCGSSPQGCRFVGKEGSRHHPGPTVPRSISRSSPLWGCERSPAPVPRPPCCSPDLSSCGPSTAESVSPGLRRHLSWAPLGSHKPSSLPRCQGRQRKRSCGNGKWRTRAHRGGAWLRRQCIEQAGDTLTNPLAQNRGGG